MDLLRPMVVLGIQTQGARTSFGLKDMYTVIFTISYSLDQTTWKTYRGNSSESEYVSIKAYVLASTLLMTDIKTHAGILDKKTPRLQDLPFNPRAYIWSQLALAFLAFTTFSVKNNE